MEKNTNNLNLMKKLIESLKNDNEILFIITKLINELQNLDPVWNNTVNKILKYKINNKFKNKIKLFFNNIKSKNYLLILNILLESYDTIDDLPDHIQEKSFYVILKELTFIFNENNITFQQNYKKSLKFLKQFRLTLLS